MENDELKGPDVNEVSEESGASGAIALESFESLTSLTSLEKSEELKSSEDLEEEDRVEKMEELKKEEKVETMETEGKVDIEALIAEAEARGYERGRNEKIEAWMNEGRKRRMAAPEPAESEVMILNNMRKSVWE